MNNKKITKLNILEGNGNGQSGGIKMEGFIIIFGNLVKKADSDLSCHCLNKIEVNRSSIDQQLCVIC